MTNERMALLELIEKGADADLIRELLAYASERLMATEVDQLTGAVAGARSPERRPASAGSSWPSRNCARARTSRPFWSHAEPRKRL